MKWKWFIFPLFMKYYHPVSPVQCLDDSVVIAASGQYSSPSLAKKLFFGSNYRKEWETEVKMPLFDLRNSHLKVVRIGGGQQTTSLELRDEKNREWSLRSVDKHVQAPNRFIENTFIERWIQDHVSAAYPYAGLSIPDLSNAAGVLAGEQKLYFVPDDPAFGAHRRAVANKVFILVNNQPQIEENITTTEMMEKLESGENFFVDQREYLKARLIDWLVADWDRHQDQWRWYQRKTDSGTVFHVVPRDRDQAFFNSDGLLAKFISTFFMPQVKGFRKDANDIKDLSNKSKEFDRKLTSNLQREDWAEIIKTFRQNVSDSVIETAIRKQPLEIFAVRGRQMIEKLKTRRDGLFENALNYYASLRE